MRSFLCTGVFLGEALRAIIRERCVKWLRIAGKGCSCLGRLVHRGVLSGLPQPVHRIGIMTDADLRPLDAIGEPFARNLYAAGRILAGYSPIAEGSTEGVDIATGVYAARQSIVGLDKKS